MPPNVRCDTHVSKIIYCAETRNTRFRDESIFWFQVDNHTNLCTHIPSDFSLFFSKHIFWRRFFSSRSNAAGKGRSPRDRRRSRLRRIRESRRRRDITLLLYMRRVGIYIYILYTHRRCRCSNDRRRRRRTHTHTLVPSRCGHVGFWVWYRQSLPFSICNCQSNGRGATPSPDAIGRPPREIASRF